MSILNNIDITISESDIEVNCLSYLNSEIIISDIKSFVDRYNKKASYLSDKFKINPSFFIHSIVTLSDLQDVFKSYKVPTDFIAWLCSKGYINLITFQRGAFDTKFINIIKPKL